MKKQLFRISNNLNITYAVYGFFKWKPLRKVAYTEKAWIEVNISYIYALNKKEAIKKYKRIYPDSSKIIDNKVYDYSDNWQRLNLAADMHEADIESVTSSLKCLDENDFFINIIDLKQKMNAIDFIEWYNDNCKQK